MSVKSRTKGFSTALLAVFVSSLLFSPNFQAFADTKRKPPVITEWLDPKKDHKVKAGDRVNLRLRVIPAAGVSTAAVAAALTASATPVNCPAPGVMNPTITPTGAAPISVASAGKSIDGNNLKINKNYEIEFSWSVPLTTPASCYKLSATYLTTTIAGPVVTVDDKPKKK